VADCSSLDAASQYTLKHYKEVRFTLEKAMKAQRGSRGIALLFL
jgi:hypothetical protein